MRLRDGGGTRPSIPSHLGARRTAAFPCVSDAPSSVTVCRRNAQCPEPVEAYRPMEHGSMLLHPAHLWSGPSSALAAVSCGAAQGRPPPLDRHDDKSTTTRDHMGPLAGRSSVARPYRSQAGSCRRRPSPRRAATCDHRRDQSCDESVSDIRLPNDEFSARDCEAAGRSAAWFLERISLDVPRAQF